MRVLNYAAASYGALTHNKAHSFAASHALRLYPYGAIYSFIPKNACSTLRLSLAIANGCIDTIEDFNWIHHNNHTFVADLPSLITAQYTFVILRCPFSRLASVYLDKIVGRDLDAWWLLDLLERKVRIEDLTFTRFVNALADEKVIQGNIHWRPQVDFLVYKQYDDYFCLEQFSTAVKTLKLKIGFDIVDARSLTAHGTEAFSLISEGDFSTTAPSEIRALKAGGHCPAHAALYTTELKDMVSTLYQEDIDLYTKLFGSESLLFNPLLFTE